MVGPYFLHPTPFLLLIHCVSVCYRKGFGIKGYGFGQGGPALLSGDVGERWGQKWDGGMMAVGWVCGILEAGLF